MIGPSPLRHPVALDFPYALELMPPGVQAEFIAWLGSYALPHPLAEVDRVAIAERHLFVRYRGDRAQLGPAVAELTSHPSAAMLAGLVAAGVLVCAARTTDPDERELYRCNVPVDVEGRHQGPHADGRFGDGAEWPNGNPSLGHVTPILPSPEDLAFLPAGYGNPPTVEVTGYGDLATVQQAALAHATRAPEALVAADRPTRRRGVYLISDDQIARALRLPPGQHVMALTTDFQSMSIMVQVEGDGLPDTAAGMHAPTVNPGWWGRRPLPAAALLELDPPERHRAVLDEVRATVLEDDGALQGRLRILHRHRPASPDHRHVAGDDTHDCYACSATGTGATWPCLDYLDAAGDLLMPAPAEEDDL